MDVNSVMHRWGPLLAMFGLSLGCGSGAPDASVPPRDGGAVVDAATTPDAGPTPYLDGGPGRDAGVDRPPYFPPTTGDTWETIDPTALGWDADKLEDALAYAEENESTAMIILHRGRILTERYWTGWDLHDTGPIFSATKSVTSLLIGILLEEGRIELDHPVTTYLGAGWTTATSEQENAITIRHLLTMTSGLDDSLGYATDPGTAWYYNTPAYHALFAVIASASNESRDSFAESRLQRIIGMQDARWRPTTLVASARDMARFGLLILNRGDWDKTSVLSHPTYLDASLWTSQSLNPAYGYLWWLNGKDDFLLPGDPPPSDVGAIMPDAPADLVAALGAGDKKIYVVASEDLVVVRHGGPTKASPALARSSFDNILWQMLMGAAPGR